MDVSKLLSVAENEVGYLEKATNSQLDDKTANAGSGNWTKYGRDLIKWIGSPFGNGCFWCDMLVEWCFITAYGLDNAKKLLGGWSAYTPTSAQYFKNMGEWYTNNPQVGDVIFFKNSQRINHTGIVYKVDSQRVYTIEGNTSSASGVIANGGCVAKKSYPLNYSSIAGYGRPKYNESNATNNTQYTYVIDVSSYQGAINWAQVKSSGIKYAILRGVTKNGEMDTTFESNYTNAIKNGVKIIGVYQFSYALDEATTVKDAKNMIAKLNGKKIDIYLDLEWAAQRALGVAKVTAIAKAYVNTCKSLGYNCHIYSNLDWYKNVYNSSELKSLGCKFWIARYSATDNGTVKENLKPNVGEYIWQFSSKGKVNGISGNVDMNVIYGAVESSTQNSNASSITEVGMDVLGKITANKLNIRQKPNTNSAILGIYTKNQLVHLSAKTANNWYKTNDGYISGKYVENALGQVVNCSKLNMRKEPNSASNNVVIVLNAGEVLTLMGVKDNWYKAINVNNIVGYVSAKYIKIL